MYIVAAYVMYNFNYQSVGRCKIVRSSMFFPYSFPVIRNMVCRSEFLMALFLFNSFKPSEINIYIRSLMQLLLMSIVKYSY